MGQKIESNQVDRWDCWVEDDSLIGGKYLGEGRPIYSSFSQVELEQEEMLVLQKHFGITPKREWHCDAGCNQLEDHLILGQLITYLIDTVGGVVDFYGALIPSLPEDMGRRGFWHYDWSDIEPYFEEMIRGMPGKIVSVPYDAGEGRTWVSHYAEVEFMKAWLKHPRFHMVK